MACWGPPAQEHFCILCFIHCLGNQGVEESRVLQSRSSLSGGHSHNHSPSHLTHTHIHISLILAPLCLHWAWDFIRIFYPFIDFL